MNILFISIAWPQPGERNLYSDLMSEFIINGHEVFVLCSGEGLANSCLNSENGINILRVPTLKIRKVNKLRKAFALFALGSRLKHELLKSLPELKVDLIIGHSPPVTFSRLFRDLKMKYNAPFYYLLKDIWPQGPADLGIIRKNGFIFRYFRYHEIRIYKTADFIGCMSPLNVEYTCKNNNYLSAEKVEVCPNSITPRTLRFKENKFLIRKKYNVPEPATVFIFSGNIGRAHGVEFYLNAVEKLKDFNKAYFLIGGSGQYFDYTVKEIARRNLTNIGTYRRLPSDDFDQLLMSCDVGVILLSKDYTVPQFPSRLLSYLEAGKPVLCSVNKGTDIGQIIENAGCGLCTLNGDLNSFIKAVKYFCNEIGYGSYNKMSTNCYNLLIEKFTSTCSYNTIMSHFKL